MNKRYLEFPPGKINIDSGSKSKRFSEHLAGMNMYGMSYAELGRRYLITDREVKKRIMSTYVVPVKKSVDMSKSKGVSITKNTHALIKKYAETTNRTVTRTLDSLIRAELEKG